MKGRFSWHILLVTLCLATAGPAVWAATRPTRPIPAKTPADRPAPSAAVDRPQARFGGAFDTDCTHAGVDPETGAYQFIVECPGKARSPDGEWAIVRSAQGEVELTDRSAAGMDDISALADDMPFVLYWSPNSKWFFVNHYLGSDLDRLRVFHIVNRAVFEESAIFADATRIAVSRYPCLGRDATVVASGWRWSRDGRRIAMAVYARPDACQEPDGKGSWKSGGDWEVLWMIGDVESGRIDPASVRVRRDGVGPMPKDGPYARL